MVAVGASIRWRRAASERELVVVVASQAGWQGKGRAKSCLLRICGSGSSMAPRGSGSGTVVGALSSCRGAEGGRDRLILGQTSCAR